MQPEKVKKVIVEVRRADQCTSITNPSIQYCEKCYAIIFGFEPWTRCPNCGNQVRMEPKIIKKVIAEVIAEVADQCTVITDPSVQYCVECDAIIFSHSKYERCPDCGNQLF